MVKYITSVKFHILLSLLLFSSVVGNAQYIITPTQKIAYLNDSVLLNIDSNVRGSIQWEASKDKVNWTVLAGKTNDTLLFKVDSSAYYRAKITEGTCNTLYSEVVAVAQVYDDRDKQIYNAVKIGNQWWMAENLNYNKLSGSSYYNHDSITYSHYGRLYTWEAANSSCPVGWHLPTDAEWKELEITVGINASIVNEIEWRGTTQAYSLFKNGSRRFDILFGGQYYPHDLYGDEGAIATFWSSDQVDSDNAWYRGFNITHGDIHRYSYSKDYGYSVRCIRNSEPVFSLDSIGLITDTTAVSYVKIYYDGGLNIIEKGICWSLSPNPDTIGSHLSAGSGSESFMLSFYPMNPKTSYYARAYLKTNEGVSYSNEKLFTTKVKLPFVLTSSVSSVTANSAVCGGNVTADADITVLSRGICWSTTQNPTISGNKLTNGTGAGSFSISITGLNPNTKYYVRAFATVDGGIAYGNEQFFTTLPLNETGTMVDSRDSKLYNTVRIGNQWWMAENLRYYRSGSWFYEDDSATYAKYGRLYSWQTANTSCPSGWHLPSDNEWKILETTMGMHVADAENIEWRGTNQAVALFNGGSTGFNIWFGGMRYANGNYIAEGSIATFWSSTQYDVDLAWYRGFNISHTDIHRMYYSKNDGYSIRCLKNMAAEIQLDSIGQIAEYSGKAYVNIKYDGGSSITERGVCWSTTSTPVYSGDHISSGTGAGLFSISMSGLSHSKTYRVRAYARNSEGLTYSNELTFVTKVALPTVTTASFSALTSNSVTSGGSVTASADVTVLTRGVCWSTATNPTIANSKTSNGTGTGTFTSPVSGLTPNTKYYLRAYATVTGGVAYGSEISFTTLPLNETGMMTDSRDGNIYKTVKIGNQWWMAENLKFYRQPGSWYYNNDSINNYQNGRLYTYQTALNSCPSGWHLPTDSEWKTMEITLGITASDADIVGWRGTNQALSLFTGGPIGFDIKFAGQYYPHGVFNDKGTIAAFWSSTEFNTTDAWYRGFNLGHGDIHRYAYSKEYGYSVRCLKNNLAVVVLDSIGQIAEFSGTAYIKISYDGGTNITERGVCWSTSANPVRTGNHISSGTGTGIFNIPISSLQNSTTYYVRAYAVNSLGESYSNQIQFTTKVALPTVTTAAIGSITSISASSGGTVTGSGITVTARGVCWSTGINPTTADPKTSNGTGTGSFTSNITSLTKNTKYYVRAYATVGTNTVYGDTVSFSTLAELPTLTTTAVTDITDSSVRTGGNITNDGGAPILERGVCWSISFSPTVYDDTTKNGTGSGAFNSFIEGLNSTTTYYVRAYARNIRGINYGNELLFKTSYEKDSVTDSRDGQKYVIVKIGNNWWMGENLNYNVTGSVYYGDSALHAETYGRLYTWAAMMNGAASSDAVPSGVQGVCPTGWHIPGNTEWNSLITALGGIASAGSALKETGNTHWNSPNSDATNETGFTARPAGIVNAALTPSEKGLSAYFWTTTESDVTNANSKKLININGSVANSVILKTSHASVRCIKN